VGENLFELRLSFEVTKAVPRVQRERARGRARDNMAATRSTWAPWEK
jgi:hypothetical protein